MSPRTFLTELHRRNAVLSVTGWIHVAALLGFAIASLFDSRTILGVSPWVKPSKFAISITIYVWTVAWYLAYLPDYARAVRFLSWGLAATMLAEILCIGTQSFRGVTSHFNFSTPLDGAIFGLMGTAILINSLLIVGMLALLFRQTPARSSAYIRSIQAGIVIFLIAGYFGEVMVANAGHTVGAPDGGDGLPFVNWSTEAGDLRVSHALGLHALQILPLIGYWLTKTRFSILKQQVAVGLATVVYAAIVFATYFQALAGNPIIPKGPT